MVHLISLNENLAKCRAVFFGCRCQRSVCVQICFSSMIRSDLVWMVAFLILLYRFLMMESFCLGVAALAPSAWLFGFGPVSAQILFGSQPHPASSVLHTPHWPFVLFVLLERLPLPVLGRRFAHFVFILYHNPFCVGGQIFCRQNWQRGYKPIDDPFRKACTTRKRSPVGRSFCSG